jgi:hypothetical protein
MKKKYWVTEQGMLMASTGNWKISNGKEISQSKYYKLLKEQKRISNELDENGIAIGDDGALYLGTFKK